MRRVLARCIYCFVWGSGGEKGGNWLVNNNRQLRRRGILGGFRVKTGGLEITVRFLEGLVGSPPSG